MNPRLVALSAIYVLWLAAPPGRAEFSSRDVGTSGANFLKLTVGGRAAAMGGAVSASVADPTALRWNPAGLAALDRYALSTMHASFLGLASYQHLGFAAPLGGRRGVGGVDLTYMSLGSITRTDTAGTEIGSFTPYNLAAGAGYAVGWGPARLGGALRFIQSRVVDTASTFALDLGAQHAAGEKLRLAAAVQNLGPGLKFGRRDPLPMLLRAGAALRLGSSGLAELDVSWARDNRPVVHLGGEWGLFRGEALGLDGRLGYTSLTSDVQGFAGPSFGLGLAWGRARRFNVDYAFAPVGELGSTHLFSLGLAWGEPSARTKPAPVAAPAPAPPLRDRPARPAPGSAQPPKTKKAAPPRKMEAEPAVEDPQWH